MAIILNLQILLTVSILLYHLETLRILLEVNFRLDGVTVQHTGSLEFDNHTMKLGAAAPHLPAIVGASSLRPLQ